MNENVKTNKAPDPVGKYPHARKVGNLLFLSGVGPRRPGTNVIPGVMMDGQGNAVGHDIEAQCHSVFENVRIILKEAGSSWKNLIDITVFLTNMSRDFDTFNNIYSDYFTDNQPCRTTVEVNSLPTPIAIELKCIATIEE
ncbi:MAG: RidA family protein [Candidatus Neomarinimicrobiota bacterium]|tara:strand:+ start:2286 stop:2705 length:420 start_codon:yes stop_codon:yes gene_type:complete